MLCLHTWVCHAPPTDAAAYQYLLKALLFHQLLESDLLEPQCILYLQVKRSAEAWNKTTLDQP